MAAFAIENFEAAVRRCGLRLTPDQTCFELGCGVGRLTAWLAPHFARVIAADISANHLGLATSVLSSRGIDNVTFLHLQAPEALESLPAFDVFRSLIVLQHNPLPIMVLILNTNLILLCPEGYCLFYETGSREEIYSFEETLSGMSQPTRHRDARSLAEDAFEIIYTSDCRVLEIREDGWAGIATGISNTFLVQKSPFI